jgi:outer membrane protein TolC
MTGATLPFVLVVTLGAAIPARAETGALALEDCVRLAAAAPSPVVVADRQRAVAEAHVQAARAGLLPRLSLITSYTRNSPLPGQPDAGRFVSLNGANEYAALLSLNGEVDLSGRLRSAQARARADADAAELSLHLSRRDLRHAVTGAYYQLLLARRLVKVAEETLAGAQQFAARAGLLEKKGEAAHADVVRALVEAQFLEQTRQAALLEAALANQELAAFWTDDLSAPLTLVDHLDDPSQPPSVPAPQPRPELALLEAQRRGLEAEARGARAVRYPQGTIGAQYGVDSNRLDWHDRGYALMVGLSIPIFDWFNAANAARAFTLQAEQLGVELQISRRAYTREYQAALARVRALYDQIAVTRAQVQLADENLRLSRVRFEGGEGSALEVVTAQAQSAQAHGNYYQVVAGHLKARADLAVAGGQ